MSFGRLTHVGPSITWGRNPQLEWAILGVAWPLKSIECLLYAAKRDNPILNNGTTAQLLQPTAMQCSRLISVTLHCLREKSAPCDAAFRRNSLTTCLLAYRHLNLYWHPRLHDIVFNISTYWHCCSYSKPNASNWVSLSSSLATSLNL